MENTISLLQICFSICLALTVVFFIISVVLFFVFDIRLIFNIRTGRAKRKTVQEMQEANSRTGRLRIDGRTQTSQLKKGDKRRKNQPLIQPPNKNNTYTGDENHYNDFHQATPDDYHESSTVELVSETSVLDKPYYSNDNVVADSPRIKFTITKKLVIVHTNEIIG